MFNLALAIAAGILVVLGVIRSELLKARIYDACVGIKVIKDDIDAFLDNMDRTRESRYNDRSRLIRQLDGYRHDWYAYEDEWACNFSMD